ncbi:MAG: hypothetical protein K5990_07710 [Oscillospiraceae bacterium]|nr:hypothetical protein [Oscillospiraceae bacterium]
MDDRAKRIFGNEISPRDYRRALASKAKYVRRFGDDSARDYPVKLRRNPTLYAPWGVLDLRVNEGTDGDAAFDPAHSLIVGNIRMGFGHYRISMAMASAAHALGYQPCWMDLNSYPDTSCTKLIGAQNALYSTGSRLSQKSRAFNRLFWEPLNYEGFRKLSYNAADQKNAELMAPVFRNVPKDIPLIATHVWPAQAALHAGMRHVVNAIPDNWPMALHLAEGSVHTVQTRSAYLGYRVLNGMRGREVLKPMPEGSLVCTGHYVDHELVENIPGDCAARLARRERGEPLRFLLSIGGAGAQQETFAAIVRHLRPRIMRGEAALLLNLGDYRPVWDKLCAAVPGLAGVAETHFDDWAETCRFAETALRGTVQGVHVFCHADIFQAVCSTNLLLRACDVLVTKPSELAFYPVPKLFLRRIGGHERWGAIHAAEVGDGTTECRDIPHTLQILDLFLDSSELLEEMCDCIQANRKQGLYDGAYRAVELAMRMRQG